MPYTEPIIDDLRFAEDDVVDPVSGQNNAVEPASIKKDNGFVRSETPPRQDFNWLFRMLWQAIRWVHDELMHPGGAGQTSALGNAAAKDIGTAMGTVPEHTAAKTLDVDNINALTSHATDTGAGISTTNLAVVLAATSSRAQALKSAVIACYNCIASGVSSLVAASYGDSRASGIGSAVIASDGGWASGLESLVAASMDSEVNATGFKAAIIASDNCQNASTEAIIAASEGSVAQSSANKIAIIGADNVVAQDGGGCALGAKDCTLDALQGGILGSEFSIVAHTNALICESRRTKSGIEWGVCGGYSGTGITPPSPTIYITVDPGGRTCTMSGTYTGRPMGTTKPVFEVEIVAATTFKWRINTDVADGTWSSPITITGAAQGLGDGVSVTFSDTTGWIAGGWRWTFTDASFTANRQWELDSQNGTIYATGTVAGSHTFTDFAEYFENLTPGIIPLGTIVALEGSKVRPAKAGDVILGTVTGTAGFVCGDTPFTWSGRYLNGEFGEPLYDEIADPDFKGEGEAPKIRVRRENPDYDPARENIPRRERAEEWSCVALIGQVHVQVEKNVKAGNYVTATGGKSFQNEPTRLLCMKIKQEFDKDKGYAVALCLLR